MLTRHEEQERDATASAPTNSSPTPFHIFIYQGYSPLDLGTSHRAYRLSSWVTHDNYRPEATLRLPTITRPTKLRLQIEQAGSGKRDC